MASKMSLKVGKYVGFLVMLKKIINTNFNVYTPDLFCLYSKYILHKEFLLIIISCSESDSGVFIKI